MLSGPGQVNIQLRHIMQQRSAFESKEANIRFRRSLKFRCPDTGPSFVGLKAFVLLAFALFELAFEVPLIEVGSQPFFLAEPLIFSFDSASMVITSTGQRS